MNAIPHCTTPRDADKGVVVVKVACSSMTKGMKSALSDAHDDARARAKTSHRPHGLDSRVHQLTPSKDRSPIAPSTL
jgi:hypothetical protein